MKKTYSKPVIIFEKFSLSTSIAAGCELDTPIPSYEANCGYPIRGGTVFADEGNCDIDPFGEYDEFCYHVPTDENNLFNS